VILLDDDDILVGIKVDVRLVTVLAVAPIEAVDALVDITKVALFEVRVVAPVEAVVELGDVIKVALFEVLVVDELADVDIVLAVFLIVEVEVKLIASIKYNLIKVYIYFLI
jgi:hypothetical protein